METSTTINVSWQDIDDYCEQLFRKIQEYEFHPDIIVTPLRGGAIPAVILAHKLGLRKIITVDAQKTEDDSIDAKKHDVTIDMAVNLEAIEGKNVLIIDEILDTGDTLMAVYNKIQEGKPNKILSAVIFVEKGKNKPVFTPDIFLLNNDRWVVFPWEKSDN